jgi:hypothetical protein
MLRSNINCAELLRYTNRRFPGNESKAFDHRYVNFDVDRLCAVAASLDRQGSPVCTAEKMEGGFSKAHRLRTEVGSELITKSRSLSPGRQSTRHLCAVHTHAQTPGPQVLAWDSDPPNPVGAEYLLLEKASGIQLFMVWTYMSYRDQLCLVSS